MPHAFTTTGGARLGWINATWPLAQLSATPDKLTISIRLLGTYSFAPDQVSAITRYVMVPVLGWGIRIHHCNADCPHHVIFWCLGSPDTLLRGIRDSGFLPIASCPQLLSAAAWQCAGHLSSSLSQSGTRFSISTSLAPAAFPRIRDRSPWLHCYLPSHFHLARSHRRGFSASFSSRVEALVRFNRFCDYLLLFPALCWSSFPFSWPAVDSTNAPNYGKGQPKPVR